MSITNCITDRLDKEGIKGVKRRNIRAIVQVIVDHEGECDLSAQEMADEAGMARATFFRWLPVAVELGYVAKEVRSYGSRIQRVSVYRLGPKIETHVAHESQNETRSVRAKSTSETETRKLDIQRDALPTISQDIEIKIKPIDNRESQNETLVSEDDVNQKLEEQLERAKNGQSPRGKTTSTRSLNLSGFESVTANGLRYKAETLERERMTNQTELPDYVLNSTCIL